MFAHTDAFLKNTLVVESDRGEWTVCGLVDWENAGWFPMEYQWRVLRSFHPGTKRPYMQAWSRRQVSEETLASRALVRRIRAEHPL